MTPPAYCAGGGHVRIQLSKYEEPILVPVTVGNRQRLFIIDSGSPVHLYHKSMRSLLGYPVDGMWTTDGRPLSIEKFRALPARVGTNISWEGELVCCADLTPLREALGRDVEGIIGAPWLREHIVRLNFDRHEMTILPSTTVPSASWGRALELTETPSGLPELEAQIGGRLTQRCIVDTGYTGSVSLQVDKYRELAESGNVLKKSDSLVATIDGYKKLERGVLSNFSIAGFTHNDLAITDHRKWNRIGLAYLRRYRLTLDFGRKVIYMSPSKEYSCEDYQLTVGIGLVRRAETTVVLSVDRDSPAERADIRVQDELVTLSGESTDGKPIAEIRSLLREGVSSEGLLELGIRRDGVEKSIVVLMGH